MRLGNLTLVLASMLSIELEGQLALPESRAQKQPVFQSEVRLIDVDVFVTDQQGRFVRDLMKDDFEVLEDGKPQAVATFSFVELPVEEPKASAGIVGAPEPDVTTNDQPEGRTYVILMDSPSTMRPGGTRDGIAYDEYARRFAREFVEEALLPGDMVAVVHAQGTFTDSQGFTKSRQHLMASIDRHGRGNSGDVGGTTGDQLTGPEQVARNFNTYSAIQEIAGRLGAMSGRRKAIIWVGGQIQFDPNRAPCPPPPEDPFNRCAISRSAPGLLTAYRDAIGAATRNNVAIYPVDPSGLTSTLGMEELSRTSALRMVAEDTNGMAVVGTNNLKPLYQEIVRDNSRYYLIGYTPATVYRDGKFHDIKVRVKRPGLKVRARKGYFAPRSDVKPPVPLSLPESVSVAARDALRMPISVRGLTMDLFSAPYKGSGGESTVVIGGQISGALRLNASDTIVLSYQVLTLDGEIRTGEYKVFTLNLRDQTRASVEDVGLRFVDRITLPKGRYELRLVADQPGGSLGSIVATLDVPDFDDGLTMSGVALAATSAAGHLTLREDEALRESLGMDPTSIRRFPVGDAIVAFAEVYSNDSRTTEDDLMVAGVVTTAAGEEVTREPASRTSTAAAAPGAWGYTIELPLVDIRPGNYVLTVEAVTAAHENRRVQRRIPFVVEAN